ncbi:MAG: serine/threonine protein kinase [Proteobacteria bacterium]|nr:serine/threonine protein kinase [Pseudomonadota bacterium]
MSERDRDETLSEARALEASGQLKSAAQLYLRAGAVQEAARLLSSTGRHKDAGNLILSKLGLEKIEKNRISQAQRKLLFLAATYLSKGGETAQAAELFLVIDERSRAVNILERAGDFAGAERVRSGHSAMEKAAAHPEGMKIHAIGGAAASLKQAVKLEKDGKKESAIKVYVKLKKFGDAARILKSLGKVSDAANMYAEAGMPYEAAVCYLEIGDTGKSLDNLIRVPRSNKQRYRKAAAHAVSLACELNVLSFRLEHFLTEFIASGPVDTREFETFYNLGILYERHDLMENAQEALKKLIAVDPSYRDAKAKLDAFINQAAASPAVYERIRVQEASFRGERRVGATAPKSGHVEGLPPLPELPNLPDLSPPEASAPNAASGATLAMSPVSPDGASAGQRIGQAGLVDSQLVDQSNGFVAGNTIEGRYLLEAKIGEGGMAMVFKAKDLELDDFVALKVFLQKVIDPKMQSESLARFKQELKLSRRITHSNIIRLYDIGMCHGHRYLSMELLEGEVLEDILAEPIGFARGIAYLIQACAGLQVAHDQGIIHRDVKPDNLFVTEEDIVKVMDFGIAKNTFVSGMTMEGMTAGTPEYMAPEQISNFSEVTACADLYSLGLIAYRMFTGVLPFEHEELMPLLMMHLNQAPRPPREINPDIPEGLEQIILRLMEKKPENRYHSCRELANDFQYLRKQFRR